MGFSHPWARVPLQYHLTLDKSMYFMIRRPKSYLLHIRMTPFLKIFTF
jgi:hypothetical protein